MNIVIGGVCKTLDHFSTAHTTALLMETQDVAVSLSSFFGVSSRPEE